MTTESATEPVTEGEEPRALTLTEHLIEFRSRLVKSAYAILVGFIIAWTFSEKIFLLIKQPIQPYLPSGGLVFTGVTDKFMAHLHISFGVAVILACPYWLYHIWKFISPGLYQRERKYAVAFVFSGVFLFITGILFAYLVAFPTAFRFLLTFGDAADKPMITIDQYLSFFVTTTMLFGLCFELPLVLVLLAMLGFIDAAFLSKNRRYAVVVIALISGAVTPPDVLSMVLMMLPLLALYEIAIITIKIVVKKKED